MVDANQMHRDLMSKHARTALRRLAIMGTLELERLSARATVVSAKHGLVHRVHAAIATLLLEEGRLVTSEIRSKDFRAILESVCMDIDPLVFSSMQRPTMGDLRKSARLKSSLAAAAIPLNLLSPVGKGANLSGAFSGGATTPKDAKGRPISQERILSIERFHNGRLSAHSHFDHFMGRKRSGGKRFDDIVDRALHVHTFGGGKGKKKPRSRRKKALASTARPPKTGTLAAKDRKKRKKNKTPASGSGARRSRLPGPGQVRLTLVSAASKSSTLSALQQHCWPGERLRRDHFRKQRYLSTAQLASLEFERTQKSRVVVLKDGKLVVSEADAVLASKAYPTAL